MFWFYASARKIEIKKSDILVSDSINVYPCKFQFSADWHDLTKTAVFRAGSTAIEILLDENLECNIPWEVLLKDKLDLFVGCYGTKGEDIILNTTWTNIGKIYEGTKNKAVPGEDPTPDIYTQITSSIGDLSQLETSDKSSLVNAINEVKNSIGSGVGPDEPLPAGVASFNGRTGSVLPQSGDYTAEMVGATPAADFEIFRENTEEDIDRIASDTADKIDKSGGTVTGPIIFSDSASAMSYTYEDESVAEEKQGVVVSSTGILKNFPGAMNISCTSKEVTFDDGTKLTGVVGDENSPTSVPNMEQVNQKVESAKSEIPVNVSELINDSGYITKYEIPTKVSQLENDANFINENYFRYFVIPSGGIIIWSGAEVPDGWALCDGTNGTPDLRGRFVLGESEDHVAGETGGEEEVTLTTGQMPQHYHGAYVKNANVTTDQISRSVFDTTSTVVTRYVAQNLSQEVGKSLPHPNMPPYYVLAYIMKL